MIFFKSTYGRFDKAHNFLGPLEKKDSGKSVGNEWAPQKKRICCLFGTLNRFIGPALEWALRNRKLETCGCIFFCSRFYWSENFNEDCSS